MVFFLEKPFFLKNHILNEKSKMRRKKLPFKDEDKVKYFISEHPDLFTKTPAYKLFCKPCDAVISHKTRFLVENI